MGYAATLPCCGESSNNRDGCRVLVAGKGTMRLNARLILAGLCGLGLLASFARAEYEETAKLLGLSKYAPPVFPAIAIDQALTSGYSTVAVAWDEQGQPTDVVVLRSSHPFFSTASIEAAKQWRRTAEMNGKGTGIYELKYEVSGVIVCGGKSLTAFMAKSKPSEPLRVATLDELDAHPKALQQPMPAFPTKAQGKYDQAKVVVEFFVDEKGYVRAPTVSESTSPEFSSEALAALKQWRFETPKKDGRPVVYSQRWAFDFRKTG